MGKGKYFSTVAETFSGIGAVGAVEALGSAEGLGSAEAPRAVGALGGIGDALDIKNFRIEVDGSLCSRDGFAVLACFDGDVRAIHVVHEADGDVILAVVGSRLYRVSVADGSVESADIAVSSSGKVVFFEFDGHLYMMDGAEIYRMVGRLGFEQAVGYVPLYGKGWKGNVEYNALYEPINMLSRYVRISAVYEGAYRWFRLGVKATAVVMYENGVEVDPSLYWLSDDGMTVCFEDDYYMSQSEIIDFLVTLDDSYWHDAGLRSCCAAALYDDFSEKRAFLFGGDDGAALYVSKPVSREEDALSKRFVDNATSLYFPRGCDLSFGDGQPIRAVRRLWDRMMICTADGTWLTGSLGDGTFAVRPMSQSMGCRAFEGLVLIEGDVPVTVSSGGLLRWKVDPSADWSCSAVCFSDAIGAHISREALERAGIYYSVSAGELWVFERGNSEGRVFVYDCAGDRWYSYVGVRATAFFEADGRMGFVDGGALCLFDESLTFDDCTFGRREIVAVYQSRRDGAGDGKAVKRGLRVFAEADLGDGELAVSLYDGGLLGEVSFSGDGGHAARLGTPRFRRVSAVLRATGMGRKRVYSLELQSGR